MIIGTFNPDNTDPRKAVPSLETRWVPDINGNDKLPPDQQAYVEGRFLKSGESAKYVSEDAKDADMRGAFMATVKSLHNFFWVDAKTGEQHELTKDALLSMPSTAANKMIGDFIVYGWFNHLASGDKLTVDEVKN